MSRGSAIFLVIVIAIALIAVAAASLLHDGLSSRAKPTAMETMMARRVRHMAIPANAQQAAESGCGNARESSRCSFAFRGSLRHLPR